MSAVAALMIMLGQQYSHSLPHTPYDVEGHAVSDAARTHFVYTLNGPQIPARLVTIGDRKLIVFEMCEANVCSEHSVVAIDSETGALFAQTVADGKIIEVVPNPEIEKLISAPCGGPSWCDL